MKKIFLGFLIVMAVILVVFAFFGGSVAAEGENLLLNPGFEDGDHIDYWVNDGNATFIWIADWHPYRGSWSYGVGNDLDYAEVNASGCCFQIACDPDDPDSFYPAAPGETFVFKMWIKGEDTYAGKASLKLEFFDYDRRLGLADVPLASFQSKVHTGQFEWLCETVSGTAPEGTVCVVASGVSEDMPIGPVGGSFVWFDEASLTAGQVW